MCGACVKGCSPLKRHAVSSNVLFLLFCVTHCSAHTNGAAPADEGTPSRAAQGQLVAEQYSAAQNVSAATPLISWSLAKSVTSALLGVRTAEPGGSGFSVRQLAQSPVWDATEVAARNITCEGFPPRAG